MRRHTKAIIPALAAAMVLTVALTAGAATLTMPDRIVLEDKTQITGVRIFRADVDGIEYQKFDGRGDRKTVPVSNVNEISWGDAGDFRRVMSLYKRARLREALELLRSLPEIGPRAFWYAPLRQLMIGKCLYRMRKYDEAVTHFETVVKQHARSYYVLTAIEGLARSYGKKRDLKRAAEAYAKLDPGNSYASPGSPEPYGKMLQWKGREQMAKLFVQLEGRAEEASKIFAGLAAGTSGVLDKPPAELKPHLKTIAAIYQRALLGSVDALIKAGKQEQARKLIEKISEQITKKSVRVGMYARLGDLLAAEAAKAPDAAKKSLRKKALLAYMRVYILYPGGKAQRARCMLGAAIASRQLGSPDDNRRALRLCKAIVAEHPGSEEAPQAETLLQTLGVK